MFEFLMDTGNYESRCVDRYEVGDLMVSTVRVSDGRQPFETAVEHPQYNNGEMVIVEAYDDADAAQQGHDRWVKRMTTGALPNSLADCGNSHVAALIGKEKFPRID